MSVSVFGLTFNLSTIHSKKAAQLTNKRMRESEKYRKNNPSQMRKRFLSPIYIDNLGNVVKEETPNRILYTGNIDYLEKMNKSILLVELVKINEINKVKNESGRNLQQDGNDKESTNQSG